MKNGSAELKKNTHWFRHDQDAFSDPKIIKLRRKYGMAGYGIYFRLLEILRSQTGYSLSVSRVQDIAYEMHTDEAMVIDVVNGFELFEVDGNVFFSSRLRADMCSYDESRLKSSEGGKKGNEKRWGSGGDQEATRKLSGGDRNKSKESNNINIDFEVFWNLYDKKVGRKSSEKKWNALTDLDRQAIMDYTPKYIASKPNKEFRKDPDTFFNNKSWTDELIFSNNGGLNGFSKNGYHEQTAPSLKD